MRALFVIALAALLSHGAALWGGLIWLDHAHLEAGLALARLGDWRSLFEQGFAGTGFYRPLMGLSLSIDAALGGSPILYHATTLLWHGAASLLTAVCGESLGLSRRAAFWAALLFAVHPVTSLVANTIAFRSESMITVALLALVIFHLEGKAWAAGAALLFGALTKETALVLAPLFVLALELLPGSKARAPSRPRVLVAEALGFGAALALRLWFAPAWRASFPDLRVNQALGTRLASLAKSTRAVFWPVDNAICDAFRVTSIASPSAVAGLAILGVLAWLAYRRRGPALLLLLAILPSLQLVPVMRWWSPHYVYLPLAFASMLVAEGVERFYPRALRFAAPVAAALALLCLMQAPHYFTDEKLWTREVSADPACREGHFYLASAAHAARRLDLAARHYEQALTQAPEVLSYVDRDAALQNLGVVRLEQRRFEDASQLFRAALELSSSGEDQRRLTHNLASAELGAGHAAEAAELLQSEVERPDALPGSIFIRARAMAALGRRGEAEALLRRLPGTSR
jgi:protein O-mannosyl-transferase